MLHSIRERDFLWTRRRWLQTAGALTVGATLTRTMSTAAAPGNQKAPLMQIGILIKTFERPNLEARLDTRLAGIHLSANSNGADLETTGV